MNQEKSNNSDQELLDTYDKLFEHLAQAPRSRVIIVRLADVCLKLGRKKEALGFYKRAINFGFPAEELEQNLKASFSEKELEGIVFPAKIEPFWLQPGKVALYPFNMQGLIVIFVGAFGLTVLSFFLFLLGGTLSAITNAAGLRIFTQKIMPVFILTGSLYILAYMAKIIRKTSKGDMDFPDWPEFSDFWDSIVRQGLLVLTAAAISFFPAILVIIFIAPSSLGGTLLLLLFFLIGSPYFSMAVLAAVKQDAFSACFNFPLILQAILKIKKHYLKSLIALWAFGLAGSILYFVLVRSFFPVIGLSLFWVVAIYFTLIEAYILGNIFYIDRKDLVEIEQGR